MTTMKRKEYSKPAMTIVELQQKTMLLQASGTSGKRNSYDSANSDVDEDELDDEGNWVWN